MLALAYHVDDLVERRIISTYAEAAAGLGITRARLSLLSAMNGLPSWAAFHARY